MHINTYCCTSIKTNTFVGWLHVFSRVKKKKKIKKPNATHFKVHIIAYEKTCNGVSEILQIFTFFSYYLLVSFVKLHRFYLCVSFFRRNPFKMCTKNHFWLQYIHHTNKYIGLFGFVLTFHINLLLSYFPSLRSAQCHHRLVWKYHTRNNILSIWDIILFICWNGIKQRNESTQTTNIIFG